MPFTPVKTGLTPKAAAPTPQPQATSNINMSSDPNAVIGQWTTQGFQNPGLANFGASTIKDPVYMGGYVPYSWQTNGSAGSIKTAPRKMYDPNEQVMPGATDIARAQSADATQTVSIDEAFVDIYGWTDEERNAFANRLYHAGIIDDPSSWDKVESAWKAAVVGSNNAYKAGRYLTPWNVVDMWESLGDPAKRNPTKPKEVTSTSYNIPSAQEAEAMVKAIFRDKIGRDPSDGELAKYRSMVVTKAKANPSVTTTTISPDGNQTSTTTGGIDLQSVAGDAVEGDDDYGVYQSVTTFYNALQSMLGAPV